MRSRVRQWSDRDDAIIRDGYERGRRCADMAAEIGSTVCAITGRATRLGLVHKYPRNTRPPSAEYKQPRQAQP